MMHMGNMTKDFVPVGKEEQAEVKDDSNAVKVAELAGIDCEWMINYFWYVDNSMPLQSLIRFE